MPELVTPSQPEREAVVARLSAAFAEDRISLEEFERRVEEVYKAATSVALTRLTSDLPVAAPSDRSLANDSSVVQMSPRLVAFLGNVERRGRLAVPRRWEVRAFCANVEVDLRDADLKPGVTEIAVRAFCANVEIVLPEGVVLENHGNAFVGSFAVGTGPRLTREPGAAVRLVRLTGRATFSNVEVTGGSGEFGGAA